MKLLQFDLSPVVSRSLVMLVSVDHLQMIFIAFECISRNQNLLSFCFCF